MAILIPAVVARLEHLVSAFHRLEEHLVGGGDLPGVAPALDALIPNLLGERANALSLIDGLLLRAAQIVVVLAVLFLCQFIPQVPALLRRRARVGAQPETAEHRRHRPFPEENLQGDGNLVDGQSRESATGVVKDVQRLIEEGRVEHEQVGSRTPDGMLLRPHEVHNRLPTFLSRTVVWVRVEIASDLLREQTHRNHHVVHERDIHAAGQSVQRQERRATRIVVASPIIRIGRIEVAACDIPRRHHGPGRGRVPHDCSQRSHLISRDTQRGRTASGRNHLERGLGRRPHRQEHQLQLGCEELRGEQEAPGFLPNLSRSNA